jgi:tripartite-type tricarboxylate transporter receptor subunit TctC
MKNHPCLSFVTLLLLSLVAGASTGCNKEGPYPNHEIEFVIPFAPGGPADTAARIIQPKISELLGVPVVLENKPGGGGALAADAVANSPADGYHVIATSNNVLTVLPWTQEGLTFKSSDFVPLGSYISDLSVIAVNANSPWKNLDQFVDYAKKNPGKLNYGSAGAGTVSFFVTELLKLSYGLQITHVPFQGSAPAKDALPEGHVDVAAFGSSVAGPLIASGDLRPLVTTASDRLAKYPDVPTMYEKGFKEASLNIWMGLFVPAGTPKEAADRLATALAKTMQDSDVLNAVDRAGLTVDYRNADAARSLVKSESAMIQRTVTRVGM